jgi:hypothetical protein
MSSMRVKPPYRRLVGPQTPILNLCRQHCHNCRRFHLQLSSCVVVSISHTEYCISICVFCYCHPIRQVVDSRYATMPYLSTREHLCLRGKRYGLFHTDRNGVTEGRQSQTGGGLLQDFQRRECDPVVPSDQGFVSVWTRSPCLSTSRHSEATAPPYQ